MANSFPPTSVCRGAGGSSPLGDVVAEADRVRVLKDGRHNTRESWVEQNATAPRVLHSSPIYRATVESHGFCELFICILSPRSPAPAPPCTCFFSALLPIPNRQPYLTVKFIGLIVSETRVTLASLSLFLFLFSFRFFLSFFLLVPVALLTAAVERNASFERGREGLWKVWWSVDEVCLVLFFFWRRKRRNLRSIVDVRRTGRDLNEISCIRIAFCSNIFLSKIVKTRKLNTI